MGGVHLQKSLVQKSLVHLQKFGVVRDQLPMRFTLLMDGVHLHVRTWAPLFRISGTDGRIVLKFGMVFETN